MPESEIPILSQTLNGDFTCSLALRLLRPFECAQLLYVSGSSTKPRSLLTATCWIFLLKVRPPMTALLWSPNQFAAGLRALPPPSAIHHVSRLVLSLILQWLRIIVPPVAGFNYSHDAQAQAVAAITSSITKNYGSANLQMHCLPVALCVAMCVCAPYMINISEANC